MAHRQPRPGTRPTGATVVGPAGLERRPPRQDRADGAELVAAWNQQLRDLGYRDPTAQPGLPIVVGAPRVGAFDRAVAMETILVRLGARRSAWNAADIRGQAEKAIAAAGIVVDPAVRTELAEDVTARVIDACMPLLHQPGVPEHVRALTSRHVLRTEADIVTRLADRASVPPTQAMLLPPRGGDWARRVPTHRSRGARGPSRLVVVEGAAGAGKTTTLAAAKDLLGEQGQRMLVVTPTLKAAQVAAREVGTAGLGGVAGPPARLPVGHRRPLDPHRSRRPGTRGGAGSW